MGNIFGDAWDGLKDIAGEKWDSVVNSHRDPIGELGNVANGDAGQIGLGGSGIDGSSVREVGTLTSPAGGMAQDTNKAFLGALQGVPRVVPTGSSARINTGRMDAATAQGNAVRGAQAGLAMQMDAAARGAVPSAAETQMQQGLEQSLRGQLAAANSARGGTGASLAAMRGAQDQGAQMQMQAMQNTAALRANEQAQARGQLSSHLGGVRGGDQSTAGLGLQFGTAQAGLDQQMGIQNMANALQSRGMDDARVLGLGGLGGQFMGMDLDRQVQQQQLGLDRDLGVLNVESGLAQAQAQNDMQKRKAGLGMAGSIMGGLFGGG